MGKKISDLTEEEISSMDLDELLLMSKEMQDSKKDNVSKTTETLKKAGSKTFDVSKQVVNEVTDIAKNEYKNYKKQRDYNKENGIDNLDDKVKRILRGYTLSAYVAKKKMNGLIKKQLDEEKGITIGDYIKEFLNAFLGKWIYLAYLVLGILVFALLIQIFRTAVIFLPVFYFLYKYIKTMMKYSNNSKIFGFNWYIYILNNFDGYHKQTALETYFDTAKDVMDDRTALEIYFEERGVASVKNTDKKKKEYAKVDEIKVDFDEHYNLTLNSKITNYHLRKSVKEEGLTAVEINDLYMTPQRNNGSELTDDVYYQVHNVVKQSVDALLGKITRDEFIDLVITDERTNYAFPEVKEKLKQEKEARELEKIKAKIAEKRMSKDAVTIVETIVEKKDEWFFNLWNGNDNMTGNKSYFKARMILRKGKSLDDIRKIKSTIEAKLRHSIVINERQDKRAFDLTVILKPQLTPFEMKCKDLLEYNKNRLIYIGKSYTGDLVTEWNYQANHIVVAGKSGSGKSEAIRELLLQLSRLDEDGTDFDYTTMFLTSSSKIGDFADFGKNGALVASGIDKQIQVFSYILNLLEEREALFFKESVQNIKDYNKKHPNDRMKQIVLLADEYENTRKDLDKKKAFEAESLIVSILNIARSSGCIVIIGAQSILNKDVGTVIDKMTIKFSGKNESNVLGKIDSSIASFYKSYKGKPQGVFFFQTDNLEIDGDYITQGETSFTLVQTPYVNDISTKTLPQLSGAEFEAEIFNGSADSSTEPSVEEMESIDLFD